MFFHHLKPVLFVAALSTLLTSPLSCKEENSHPLKTFFIGSCVGATAVGIVIASKGKIKLPRPALPWNKQHQTVMNQIIKTDQTITSIKTECKTLTNTTNNHTELLKKLQESVDLLKIDTGKLVSQQEAIKLQQDFIANQVVHINHCVDLLTQGFIAKFENKPHRISELIESFKNITWIDTLLKKSQEKFTKTDL